MDIIQGRSQLKVNIITAVSPNGVIGLAGDIPWRCKEDLQHFKRMTMDCPMIMGRKTFTSLPGILPGRPHIVMTEDRTFSAEGAYVVHSYTQAIEVAQMVFNQGGPQVAWVIGGSGIYDIALETANELHITWMKSDYYGDTFFPPIDASLWEQFSDKPGDSSLIDSYQVYHRPLH